MKAPFLIGRLIFGGYFIYNGINHFKQTETIAQYAGAKKVPRPREAVMATGAMMLLGGTSILLGIKPKYGAAAILGGSLADHARLLASGGSESAHERHDQFH